MVCTHAPNHMSSSFPAHNKDKSEFMRVRTGLGEMAAVDCENVWKLVFGRFPAELFNDHFLAHELLRFLRLNLENLQLRVPQYIHFFPNLLKVKILLCSLYMSAVG